MGAFVTISDKLLSHLYTIGIRHIFLIPGAQIDPLSKSLIDFKLITPIIVNHELSAGYMAEGYAGITSNAGVVFSIGGPGAMYLIGSAVNARLENKSIIYITGSVPKEYYGTKCFQDTSAKGSNDVAIFKAAIGSSIVCKDIFDIDYCMDKIDEKIDEEQPLHIVIPLDVQKKNLTQDKYLVHQAMEQTFKSTEEEYSHLSKDININNNNEILSLKTVMNALQNVVPTNTICCLDAGQVRQAGNKYLKNNDKITLMQSSKQAPMGWALCASIGIKLGNFGNTVIAISGDGSMRMHGMELSTAVKYTIPIVYILCDNQSYGTVYSLNKNAPYDKLSHLRYINWQEYAHSLGVETFHVTDEKMLKSCFQRALKLKKTCLVWIHTAKEDDIIRDVSPTQWLKGI